MLWFPTSRKCPKCGAATHRTRTRWYARPVRWLFPHRASTRVCRECLWRGVVILSKGGQ